MSIKWYQGKIDSRKHAFMKAEAQLNDQTIIDYINSLIEKDLAAKGYDLDGKRKETVGMK